MDHALEDGGWCGEIPRIWRQTCCRRKRHRVAEVGSGFQTSVLEDWLPGATSPAGLGRTCRRGVRTALSSHSAEKACIQQGHRYVTDVDNDDVESLNRG